MRRRRGLLLMVVLLLSTLLCLLAIAYLGRSAENHRASAYAVDELQAYELARAGLESARVKLDKDFAYPPNGPEQEVFSCCEAIYQPDGQVAGYCQLTVDTRWRLAPYQTVRIGSVGLLGSPGQPQARRKLWAELDVNPVHPGYFQFVHFRDEGCP